MPKFEELWLSAPTDLSDLTDDQIAKAKAIAKHIYNQVRKHAQKQKAA